MHNFAKITFLSCVFAITAMPILAHQGDGPKPSPASQKYHEYRLEAIEPKYGLAKIKGIVKRLKEDEDMNRRMKAADYNSLSVAEKFTYVMIHGEDFSQNCSDMPPIVDEQKKIFAYAPGIFDDQAAWSDRQRQFLKSNRTAVIKLIRETMTAKHRVGVNLKSTILEINAVELIPDLARIYNRDKKDHDILTIMCNLMKENKFKPFLASPTGKKLYGDENDYQANLDATSANRKLVLDRALAFHKSWKK